MVDGVAVLEAAVEAKNGRLYVVDGVLTPPSIKPVLPHRCDITDTQIIKVRANSSRLPFHRSLWSSSSLFTQHCICFVWLNCNKMRQSCCYLTSTHCDTCGNTCNMRCVPVCPPDLNAVVSFITSV